jgi:uncharacterized protein YjbJ (UPF0337 family)
VPDPGLLEIGPAEVIAALSPPFGRVTPPGRQTSLSQTREAPEMGITDKLTGRVKKAAGDLADDPSMRREGRNEERKGEAKDELARSEEKADRKADEVADLERRT